MYLNMTNESYSHLNWNSLNWMVILGFHVMLQISLGANSKPIVIFIRVIQMFTVCEGFVFGAK